MNIVKSTSANEAINQQTIYLDRQQADSIERDTNFLLANCSFQVDSHADILADQGSAAIGKVLNADARSKLEKFGRGCGSENPFVLVHGLPQRSNLPNTPQGFHDDADVQFIDCQLLGLVRLAGMRPVAYSYENFGRLMRNVVPVATASESLSSHGAKKTLRFHTDNAYEFEGLNRNGSPAPRVLAFAGLRNADARGVPVSTDLLPIQKILDTAEPALLQELRRTSYRMMPGDSNSRDPIGPVALLESVPAIGTDFLRFNANPGQVLGLNPAARTAVAELSELIESLEDYVVSLNILPGSIAMFDNYRVLHRRSNFEPGTDLTQARWLRRLFACRDLSQGMFVDRRHRPFVWA